MARLTSQIKSVASVVISATMSVAFGVWSKRFFDTPSKPAALFLCAGFFLLLCQIALVFVESKEEEELSLLRRMRMGRVRLAIEEQEAISIRIQNELQTGNIKEAKRWIDLNEEQHGK